MDEGKEKVYRASALDVAQRYGVHLNTVYNWLRSLDPPPHKRLGKEYRFNLEEVDDWASQRTLTKEAV